MWTYYELLTDMSMREIEELKARVAEGVLHPKQAKVDLAKRVITDFHSSASAQSAADEFDRVFARKEVPADLPVLEHRLEHPPKTFERILADAGYASSGSDALRKIQQGGVRIDGEVFKTPRWQVSEPGDHTVQVGRRSFLLRVVAAAT